MPKGNFNTADQSQSYNRQRRGQSGRPGGRVAGLETIYMTKIPKLKPAMNMNVSQSNHKQRIQSANRGNPEYNPFRPTLDRFADDPSELNVDTQMHGNQHHHGGGRDILEIADQLDQMQRDYLYNKHASGTATQKMPMAPNVNPAGEHDVAAGDLSQQQINDGAVSEAAIDYKKVSGVQSHYVI